MTTLSTRQNVGLGILAVAILWGLMEVAFQAGRFTMWLEIMAAK